MNNNIQYKKYNENDKVNKSFWESSFETNNRTTIINDDYVKNNKCKIFFDKFFNLIFSKK